MKKRIAAIVSLFIVGCVCAGLGACATNNSGEHEHTFSTAWSVKDAYSHWHAATCEHTDLGKDEEPHDIGDDYRCAACGYSLTPTEGLVRELNADGKSYSIVGVDKYVKDVDIVIPLQYGGLPVTAISDGAFSERTTLKSIRMPVTVTSVGKNAFYNCVNLMEVSIPNYVTNIGAQAFYGCFSLEYVKMGSSIASIGADAFAECDNLQEVNITNLEGWCNVKLDSLGSNPFNNGADLFINGEAVQDLIIPDTITKIEQNVFYNLTLASITLPESILEIRNNAFYGLAVDSVNYAGSVAKWSKISFANNYSNPLFAADSFYANNQKVTEITISGIDSVEQFAFAGYKALTSVSLKMVETIGANAFSDCVNLTDLSISDSVLTIGDNAFSGCVILKDIELGNNIKSIGNNAFFNCKLLSKIVMPAAVSEIGEGAFRNCINLVSVALGEKVTTIGNAAFDGCYKLVEIFNFSTLNISMGNETYGSVGLYALDIYTSAEDVGKLTTTADGYIFYDGLEKIYLLSYVGNESQLILPEKFNDQDYGIYDYTFCYLDNLTEIVIPESVLSIGLSAFDNCKGLIYNEYQNGLYLAFGSNPYGIFIKVIDTAATSVTINGSTKMIADCAFMGANISSISIPDDVVSLGDKAFYGCENLKSVTFNRGLKNIGARAFYGCTALESLTLHEGVISIGKSAFFNCSGMRKLILPDSLTDIGANAFDGVRVDEAYLPAVAVPFIPKSYLITVTVTSGERLEDGAFSNSSNLTTISLPDTIKYVGLDAFSNCPKLVYTEDNDGTYLGNSENKYLILIAAKNSTRTEFTLSEKTKIIYDGAFKNFQNLATINCEGIYSIGYQSFYQCYALSGLSMAEGASYIGSYAFYNSGLTSIDIPDSVTDIGSYAFYMCSKLQSVTIPDGVTQLLNSTFYGCSVLKSVALHDHIDYIGPNAFAGTNLTYNVYSGANYLGTAENKYLYLIKAQSTAATCTIHDDVRFICLDAFNDSSITAKYVGTSSNPYLFLRKFDSSSITNPSMSVNERTEYIGSLAFTNVTKIGNVTDYTGLSPKTIALPESVKYIGSYAFRGNSFRDGGSSTNLTTIYISGNVIRIELGMLFSCYYISDIYFDGTYEQWKSIINGSIYDSTTCQYSSLTIHCTDINYKAL